MSWEEVKKAREVWPPDIEKILEHYKKAEKIDSRYYQIYKDRARLFYILKEYEKCKNNYEIWKGLDIMWKDEVTREMTLLEQRNIHNVHPWQKVQKYLGGDTRINPSKKGQKNKSVKKNKRKNTVKIKKKITDYGFTKQFEYEKYNNVSDTYKENEGNKEFFQGIKNKESEEHNIENECAILIRDYKKRVNISEHNVGLIEDMIEAYEQIGSLRTISQVTGIDILIIRRDFRNLLRVPIELKELVMKDKLTADPILAREIAVYATDYFEWDHDESKTNKVIEFAKNMAKTFNDTLNLRREFFATNDDYSKPISATTKKNNELNAILEDWPVKESKYEFNKFTDRSGKQYRFIVFYSKNLDAVRFVRRWEYEKGRRISKKWASEIIDQIKNQGNIKEFLKEYSNEFND